MRIGIFSLSRSGSSPLFYHILAAMPPGAEERFEPDVAALEARPLGVSGLAKIILDSGEASVPGRLSSHFDHTILLTRDLRDQVVSAALFSSHGAPEADFERFLAALERKQRSPRSISFADFLELAHPDWNRDRFVAHVRRCIDLVDSAAAVVPAPLLLRYEDFVDNGWERVGRALGLEPAGAPALPGHRAYGKRRVTPGDWKNWFTPEDISLLRPVVEGFMERYGYPADWDLSPAPVISEAESLGFVLRCRAADRAYRREGILWGESSL